MSLRFPGQYFDAETGLFYNYFRDHDPQTGRYVQSDPIGLRGGPNTYLYVLADPLGLRDPLGLIACFYDPPNFDTTNCFLVSKSYTDRDFYQWRDTDVGQIAKIYIPKPRWGGGPPLPNPRLPPTQPPVRPTVQTQGYWEIVWGYDESTLYRQNVLYVDEEWMCTSGNQCRPDDATKKRRIMCFGDWTATATRQRSYWLRSYYKPLQ